MNNNYKKQPYIIAELAQGFEGKLEQALLLLKAAAAGSADAAKFQLVYADELGTPDYKYYDLFRQLEMEVDEWIALRDTAAKLNIELQVDIFGIRSLRLAEEIGLKSVKLHGTDTSNIGFLEQVANSKIHTIILGVGGATRNEISVALDILKNKQVILLFGFQAYPTPTEANQISRIAHANEIFDLDSKNVLIGFADHAEPNDQTSFALAATAIGAGAKVIEKHLTLGKVMELEDFEAALNPDEFNEFSRTIRACASAFGETKDREDFGMSEPEKGYREMIRRHVVLDKDIEAGEIIQPNDVILKRSAIAEPITDINFVYHKKVIRTMKRLTPIVLSDLEQ